MNGKFLSLLVCCLILGSSGKPTNVFLSYQDSLGQYSFGYSAPGSARSEVKTLNGVTRGAYSYVDENGVIQTAEYVADDDGFRIVASNLPQAPLPIEETAEVAAARKEHFEAFRLAQRMAEEAENKQESNVLLKESVKQNEGSESENREGLKATEEVLRMEQVSNMDNQALILKEAEAKPNEESIPNASNISVLKDRLTLDKVPVFRITYGNDESAKILAIEQDSNDTSYSS